MPSNESYDEYVEHPRFGRSPNYTGLNPETDFGGDTFIHWHSPKSCRVANTAIEADLSKQTPATVPVSHYYDVKRKCRDCEKMFLFFAAEQKYWYEELGFGLDSDCVRCVWCRGKQNELSKLRKEYEDLRSNENRSKSETLKLAEYCMQLIEKKILSIKSAQRVRQLLNSIESEPSIQDEIDRIRISLTRIENESRQKQ